MEENVACVGCGKPTMLYVKGIPLCESCAAVADREAEKPEHESAGAVG